MCGILYVDSKIHGGVITTICINVNIKALKSVLIKRD